MPALTIYRDIIVSFYLINTMRIDLTVSSINFMLFYQKLKLCILYNETSGINKLVLTHHDITYFVEDICPTHTLGKLTIRD